MGFHLRKIASENNKRNKKQVKIQPTERQTSINNIKSKH